MRYLLRSLAILMITGRSPLVNDNAKQCGRLDRSYLQPFTAIRISSIIDTIIPLIWHPTHLIETTSLAENV